MPEFTRDQLAAKNRDEIRRLAAAAGVVNVSYKSKVENIDAILEAQVAGSNVPADTVAKVLPGYPLRVDVPVEQGTSPFDDAAEAARANEPEIVTVSDFLGDTETGYGCETIEAARAFMPGMLDEEIEEYWHAGGEVYLFTEDEVASFRRRIELGGASEPVTDGVLVVDVDALADATARGLEEAPPLETDDEPRKRAFNLSVDADGRSAVTFVTLDGEIETVNQTHVAFVRIVDALLHDQDPDPFLSLSFEEGTPERANAIIDIVGSLSSRVKIGLEQDNVAQVVLFDGEVVHGTVVDAILRYYLEGRDASNIVKFLERVQANPNPRSREQLFEWAGSKNIAIDPDGFLLGFKGVNHSRSDREGFESSHKGWAIVNGAQVGADEHGQQRPIPQKAGDVIEIPFDRVDDDHRIGCAFGLHVGNYAYASHFARVVLEVRVDPADVVAVPSDSSCQKMRVARYEVIGEHGKSAVLDPKTGESEDVEKGSLAHLEPEATFDESSVLVDVLPKSRIKRLFGRRNRKGN